MISRVDQHSTTACSISHYALKNTISTKKREKIDSNLFSYDLATFNFAYYISPLCQQSL